MVSPEFEELIFEPEFLLSIDLAPNVGEETEEDLLIQLPGAMGVGIGQGGMAGGSDAQMFQFSLTASKASGNLPERMGAAQLTEVHGHKLAPAGKPSGMSFF